MCRFLLSLLIILFLVACLSSSSIGPQPSISLLTNLTSTPTPFMPASITPTAVKTPIPVSIPTLKSLVPDFSYIILIIFENKEFGTVIGNPLMPIYNRFAQEYVLFTEYYAVIHPSLPNYLAMMAGDTFNISTNCEDCFINAPSLPDYIEASGRTWKTYQEDMPHRCFIGSWGKYSQKHNPFIYFDPIRLDKTRCERSIVPLLDLAPDLAAGILPNFAFIMPNLCNSAHDSEDCPLNIADAWLGLLMDKLLPNLEMEGKPYLIVLTWDEGQGDHSCCGLPEVAGGRIPTVFVSNQVKRGYQDDTQYTHYSLLKTIAEAWGLPYLGHSSDENNKLIIAPWY